ncbi:MAG: archaeal heat shock protein Hsp20 [Patescibacteria group bacterium]
MVKKKKFKEDRQKKDRTREDLKNLEDLPLVGGLFKGLEKFIDLAEKVEEAGGEIKRKGEIKGLGGETKGIYGFSIRSGIGSLPQVQTFGNIRPVQKKTGKKEIKVEEIREPLVDVFDEKDHILIIAELPGVAKERIKLDLKGDILTLRAENEKRKYAKEILLPHKVDFEQKKVNFKNGVLEIKLMKTR